MKPRKHELISYFLKKKYESDILMYNHLLPLDNCYL